MKKFSCLPVILLFLAVVNATSQTPTPNPTPSAADPPGSVSSWYKRPSGDERRKSYVNSIVGPYALGRYVVGAGIGTARNSPEEWGPGWEGFGRRVASSVGQSVVRNSVQYGLDEALKVDSKFYRSRDRSYSARVRNSFLSVVTARNVSGKRVFGAPKFAGTITSNLIAYNTWYPKRFDSTDAMRKSAFSLASGAAFNLFKEFILRK